MPPEKGGVMFLLIVCLLMLGYSFYIVASDLFFSEDYIVLNIGAILSLIGWSIVMWLLKG